MSEIYLSLAVLARDPEGAATLERALRSALERPDGPMFDEVAVLFGGSPSEKCRDIVARLAAEFPSVAWATHDLPAGFPLTETGGLADFAAARNFLYERCRGAWIGYIDADDVIPSADGAATQATTLKAFLKSLPRAFNVVAFAYHYSHDVAGNVTTATTREWVRWRDGFAWVNRAPGFHEAIYPVFPNKKSVAELRGFHVEHRSLGGDVAERRFARNDALLDASRFLGTEEWGVRYYLARQAERHGQFDRARELHEQSAAIARGDEETYTSLHGLSRVLRWLGRNVESMSSALLAHNVAPERGEAIGSMVLCSLDVGDPARAAIWYGRLPSVPRAHDVRPGVETSAYEIDLWPHVAGSRALLALERFDEAVAAAERAVTFAPYDVGATRALKDAVAARDLRRARDAARYLIDFASRRDNALIAIELAGMLPYELEHDPVVADIAASATHATCTDEPLSATARRLVAETPPIGHELTVVPYGTAPDGPVARRDVYTPERFYDHLRYAQMASWIERLERVQPDDSDPCRRDVIVAVYRVATEPEGFGRHKPKVVFYCPEAMEPWGPWTQDRTGIGGSEEMVVQVARHLAAAGAQVTVYAPVADVCVDRNVVWLPYRTFDPEAACDVLISHRTEVLSRREKIGAAKHYIWLHDSATNRAEDYGDPMRARVAGYLMLSRWHADTFASAYGVARAQMMRVPNVPDTEDRPGSNRRPFRAVYASAPFRGLTVLLRAWPLVREKVPEAELRVCGDWLVHDLMARQYPELNRIKAEILKGKDAPGVVFVGKLAAPALRAEFQAANVLVYPSTFYETSCRTAIRAMACGCVPVYRPLAALEETIGPAGIAVPGDPAAPEYLQAFADAVIAAMLAPRSDAERLEMAEDVRRRHDPWKTWLEIAGLTDRCTADSTTPCDCAEVLAPAPDPVEAR